MFITKSNRHWQRGIYKPWCYIERTLYEAMTPKETLRVCRVHQRTLPDAKEPHAVERTPGFAKEP